MKGKIVMMLCFLSLSTVLMTAISVAGADVAVSHFGWVEPAYVGKDPYFNENIVAYVEGTNWTFSMSWVNSDHLRRPINISSVEIGFDWGKNYTYRLATPVLVAYHAARLFTVSNVTAPVDEAPELWRHHYEIWVRNVNSTGSPREELESISVATGTDFVILSTDHMACLNLLARYSVIFGTGTITMQMTSSPLLFFPNVTKVQILLMRAYLEYTQGLSIYGAGVFSSARAHLQQADSLYSEALTVWDEFGTSSENASLAYLDSQTNYSNALAESSRTNGYGWLLFGLGWMFIGLGVIAYGLRRPKTATV